MKITLAVDCEVYSNYFVVMFRRVDTMKMRYYEMYPGSPLDQEQVRQIMGIYRTVGFNSNNYDCPILALALTGADCAALKRASDSIIQGNLRPWQFKDLFGVQVPKWDHIDLSEVAPGVMISLKQYAARMHSRRLQDLPIHHDAVIEPEQRELIRDYCGNSDLPATIDLWNNLTRDGDNVIAIREEVGRSIGVDLRSKSDAQMAEALLRTTVERRKGHRILKPDVPAGSTFRYVPPAFIRFDSPHLRAQLESIVSAAFVVRTNGKVAEPPMLRKDSTPVEIASRGYKMGIGGLHSTEKSVSHWAERGVQLCDVDVASFYPELIRQCGLAPTNMGSDFSDVYSSFIDRRLAAKAMKHTTEAQTLKIALNGTFGKLGSPYSILYAPHLLIQVTLTGQLMLLMMIERMEAAGIEVVSANTDGIVLKYPSELEPVRIAIVKQWEREANFKTEETRYRALCSKDVNNYFAIKPDGGVKTKGEYAKPGLMKNPENEICNDAVMLLLSKGVPVEQTILGCTDVRKFINVMRVTGGATYDGQYLGKVVRWIYRKGETRDIRYLKANEKTGNHNKVSNSDGAMPLMILPDEVPSDIDYDRYIAKAYGILDDVGVDKMRQTMLQVGDNADLFFET